jgi:signal transduction histidine kinase
LSNLLSNANKYSPDGGVVRLELTRHAETVIVRIQDEGIGIPPEDQKQLFQPFTRAKNVGAIPGTGLGLTIVKKCVEAHNGQIFVASEVGVGSTFTVTLPLTNQS